MKKYAPTVTQLVSSNGSMGLPESHTSQKSTHAGIGNVMQAVPPLLLDIEQASQALCLGKTKIRELMESGDLPVVRIGKALRFSYGALQQWVERQAQQDVA